MLDPWKGVEPIGENKCNLPPTDKKNAHVTSDMKIPEMFQAFGYGFSSINFYRKFDRSDDGLRVEPLVQSDSDVFGQI
jgi:hypothetical protein